MRSERAAWQRQAWLQEPRGPPPLSQLSLRAPFGSPSWFKLHVSGMWLIIEPG